METILPQELSRISKNTERVLRLAQKVHQTHSDEELLSREHHAAILKISWHLDTMTIGASIRRTFCGWGVLLASGEASFVDHRRECASLSEALRDHDSIARIRKDIERPDGNSA